MMPPAAEPQAPAQAEPEQDLFTAMRAETAKPPVAEMPDWLTSGSSAQEPPAGEAPPLVPGDMHEAATPPAEPTAAGLPDWLSEPAAPEKPAEEAAPTPTAPAPMPDWLSEGSAPSPETPAPAATPDWLDQAAAPEKAAAAEVPSPPEMPTHAAPDWLTQEPGQPAGEAVSAMPDWLSETAPPVPPSPAGADMPEWLKAAQKADETVPVQPAEPPPATPAEAPAPAPPSPVETPDWLNTLAEPAPPPAATLAETPAPAPSAPVETPDWLNALAEPAPPAPATPAEAPAPAPTAPVETPDWLNALAEPAPSAPVETPDWLNTLAEPAPPPPTTPAEAPAPAPSAPVETPDWLNALAEPASPAPATPAEVPAPSAPVETPDWLNTLAEPTTSPAPSASPAPAADMADLLSGIDLGPSAPAATGTGEDLLGMTGDLAPTLPPAAEEGEAESATPGQLPEWLRSMDAGQSQEAGSVLQASTLPPGALTEINDLRFDKIIGPSVDASAAQPEKVGALKNVVGAIQPEIIFDAQTLKAGQLISDSVLTKEQSQRVVMLEELLAHKTEEVAIAGTRRRALPVVRWVVILLLMAAVIVPFILKVPILTAPGSASSGPADAKSMLTNLGSTGKIVVAFDYEPDTSAELDPLALAILGELALKPDAHVYAVSTRATGPALAERAFQRALSKADQAQRANWVDLGYIPGGPNGIATLTNGSPAGLPSALGVNAVGKPSGVAETSLLVLKPSLIVVLTASGEDLRGWVEQAGRPTGIPILAATSAGNMPLAAPYRQSGQITALMSGVNDAVALRALTGENPDPGAASIWNAQATGGLAAAAAIIVGGVIFGLAALREQREQSS
jgi:hypothetical protein